MFLCIYGMKCKYQNPMLEHGIYAWVQLNSKIGVSANSVEICHDHCFFYLFIVSKEITLTLKSNSYNSLILPRSNCSCSYPYRIPPSRNPCNSVFLDPKYCPQDMSRQPSASKAAPDTSNVPCTCPPRPAPTRTTRGPECNLYPQSTYPSPTHPDPPTWCIANHSLCQTVAW